MCLTIFRLPFSDQYDASRTLLLTVIIFRTLLTLWADRRHLVGAGMLALGVMAGLSACTSPEAEVTDVYAQALLPEFASLPRELNHLPRYQMDVWFQPHRNHLDGALRISGINTSTDTWQQLVFRLYPNLFHYGGRMTITKGSLTDGSLVPFRLEVEDTAAVFLLAQENWIDPNEAFTFHLEWSLDLPVLPDVSSVYVRFGRMLGFHSVPLFYPSLAPYLPGTPPNPGYWWLEEAPPQGDVAFNQASFFDVILFMPPDYPPVTSGVTIAQRAVSHTCPFQLPWADCTAEQQAQCLEVRSEPECRIRTLEEYRYVAGPTREFALITHPDYESVDFDVNGIMVTSYWVPAYAASGLSARDYAVAALRIYTRAFGPYPYPTLNVAMAPLANGSMEYPLLNQIGLQLYRDFEANLESQIAFAVAHQWWYQLVHNDPVNEPWLDEALSTLSTLIYLEQLYGPEHAELFRVQEWEVPVAYLQARDRDAPIDLRVNEYATNQDFQIMVYRKGALFFHHLREAMAHQAFRLQLSEIMAEHRFGLIDSEQLLTYFWDASPSAMILIQDEYLDARHRR